MEHLDDPTKTTHGTQPYMSYDALYVVNFIKLKYLSKKNQAGEFHHNHLLLPLGLFICVLFYKNL